MTEGEVARAGDPPGRGPTALAPERRVGSTVPPSPPRGRPAISAFDDAPPRAPSDRRWWSLRGLGPRGWTVRIVLVLLIAVMAWGIAGYIALNSAVSQANARITTAARKALTPASGSMWTTPTNILFIGADARPGDGASRSDTLMVMRVDPNAGKIKYLSIPRDTLVNNGQYAGQKINAAYFFGGEAGAISTVEQFTGLPINHVVVVGFAGLTQIVNGLGGVTLNNPTSLKNCAYTGGIRVSFPRGLITLNGKTALQYVRVRDCDTDFQREARQQVFLAALKSKIISPSLMWQAPWNGADLVSTLSTDMSTMDLAAFGWQEMNLSQPKADHWVLSGTPTMINGIDYVVTNRAASAAQLKAFLGKN